MTGQEHAWRSNCSDYTDAQPICLGDKSSAGSQRPFRNYTVIKNSCCGPKSNPEMRGKVYRSSSVVILIKFLGSEHRLNNVASDPVVG